VEIKRLRPKKADAGGLPPELDPAMAKKAQVSSKSGTTDLDDDDDDDDDEKTTDKKKDEKKDEEDPDDDDDA